MSRGFQLTRSVLVAAAVVLVSASPTLAQQRPAPATTVAGKWSLMVRTDEGPQPRSLDLAVAQDSIISGTLTSALGTLPIETGRINGDRLRLEFAMAGGEIRVSYDVVVRGDTLRGTFRQDAYEGEVLGVRGDRPVRFPSPNG